MKKVVFLAVVSILTITNIVVAIIVVDSLLTTQQQMISLRTDLLSHEDMIRQEVQSLLPYLDKREQQFDVQFTRIKERVISELTFVLKELRVNRLAIGELRALLHIQESYNLTVTAYSPAPGETDGIKLTTATKPLVTPRKVAVSRDLLAQGWTLGKRVYIEGLGICIIGDTMDERWERRINVQFDSRSQANQFGKRNILCALLSI